MSNTKRRVVVTGVGAVTPLGRNVEELWDGLARGESGIGDISLFQAGSFPTRIAAEIRNFNFDEEFPEGRGDRTLDGLNRHAQFALLAAREALQDSGLDKCQLPADRMGVYFASGEGSVDFKNFATCILSARDEGESNKGINDTRYVENSHEHLDRLRELEQEPGMAVYHLAKYLQVRGPVSNCLTACAASSQAIGEAAQIIRRGDADVMVAGGAHSMIHQMGVMGFNLLTALSVQNENPSKASRPFDMKRDGFVIGEGSGLLILEALESAQKRGAHIYGEIIGYGSTADAYRLTDAHPEGRGAIQAMELALQDAGCQPDEISYINAHGTSTAVNDSIETHSIRQVFGEGAKKIPVSSIKSMTGHLIAAAGAVELIACLLAMKTSTIPPTVNQEFPDPDCDLDYVPNQSRKQDVDLALSNSFGFGGQNITLIVKKWVGED